MDIIGIVMRVIAGMYNEKQIIFNNGDVRAGISGRHIRCAG
jgi:hypothetical protein